MISVSYTAVTATDFTALSGKPYIVRLFSGLFKPSAVLGDVFVGSVKSIGTAVTDFREGDPVYGTLAPNTGSHAQYIKIDSSKVVAPLPEGCLEADVAAMVDGPLTAYSFLTKHAKLQKGQKALINGASGSVGIAAVQLAKHLGAEVSAVCSSKNTALVKQIGADYVIDYKKQDFTQQEKKYDIIIDAVNKSSYAKCKAILNHNGKYLTTGPSLGILISYITSRFTSRKASMPAAGPFWTRDDLDYVSERIQEGVFTPVIDSQYSLSDMQAAFERVGTGHKVGSVVVKIDQ